MKIVLIGHPASQCIVPASKYLTSKYLPGFYKIYLNYKGKIEGWGTYVAVFLEYLTDEFVIFALDDYLVADTIDKSKYIRATTNIGEKEIGCVKLCYCTPEENSEYPITTQYTLWKREYLIELLYKHHTPWQFEIEGSKQFDKVFCHEPCVKYFTNSSLSSRWEGVRLDGLKEEDLNYIKANGLIL